MVDRRCRRPSRSAVGAAGSTSAFNHTAVHGVTYALGVARLKSDSLLSLRSPLAALELARCAPCVTSVDPARRLCDGCPPPRERHEYSAALKCRCPSSDFSLEFAA
jgi:hypothetical protein